MDTQGPSPPAPPAPPGSQAVDRRGGTVEPVDRARREAELFRNAPPLLPEARHYELKDPFAEVTYRSERYTEITARADRLGSLRVTAVDPDNSRTRIEKVNGRWPPEPGRSERAVPPGGAKVVPISRDAADDPSPPRRAAEPQAPAVAAQASPRAQRPPSVSVELRSDRESRAAALETALSERYVIKRSPVRVGELQLGRTEYRFRGESGRVAFTESTFKLATETNNPSVARSMVDVAEARGWKALRISGNEDFRRLVWMEATVRGVKAIGYEPTKADLDLVAKEREARQVNRIEPVPATSATDTAGATKGSGRGGGRKAVLAAIEAVLIDRKVPQAKRDAIMAATVEQLAQRLKQGQQPSVKVYDRDAPSQRTQTPATPEPNRGRERSQPVR